MAKHRRGGLRLANDPDCHIGLGQPGQRLLDVARGLVPRHHGLEAVDGAGVITLLQIVAADFHFLAGELVARAFQLLLGAGGVFRGRIFANHFLERRHRLFGAGLVARDVRNLVVMRGRDQVLGVGRIGTAGMQGDVAGGGADAAVVVAGLVEGVGRHQQRLARPVRIGMLAVDFLELLRRRFRVAVVVHQEQALVVELVGGLLVEGIVLGEKLVPQRPGAAAGQRRRQHDEAHHQPQPAAQPAQRTVAAQRTEGWRDARFERQTLCRHGFKPDVPDAMPTR